MNKLLNPIDMMTQTIRQKETKEVNTKYVYTFGRGKAEGNTQMKNLLGGKGANLCEMTNLGIPVPPGFVISTEACTRYSQHGREDLMSAIREGLKNGISHLESIMGTGFGDSKNPLLISVRSGARVSMPGMMDTVLNLGLNDEVVEGLSQKFGESRFAWDAYRRFIQMYGDVVMGLKPENKDDEDPFEVLLEQRKKMQGVAEDHQLSTNDLKELVVQFKVLIKQKTGVSFPTDPWKQLEGAVSAVFESWNNDRAKVYRELNGIPGHWGTAVNVQAMVYGNLNDKSATGVAFTRDAATGEDLFNGEFLVNAQGEDVVAGIRTPQQISLEGSRRWAALAKVSEADRKANYPSLEELMPAVYQELLSLETQLENHYADMQDLEFTIQEGKLWILQTRNGKRTGAAMVKIAMEMLEQGMIDKKTALLKVDPHRLDELLHPIFLESAMTSATTIAKGLPASPGAATGQIVFFADDAESWASQGKKTILVRTETSPEDLRGMHVAEGILTARGGMTSHAAVVARGMGKCCISGAGAIHVDYKLKTMAVDGQIFREGDWISLNGSTGEVFEGRLETEEPSLSGDFGQLMELADQHARLSVRTNADTPEEARTALRFGAKGIGLCRTEHMFFEGERILPMREMILAVDEKGRRAALKKLLVLQKQDFKALFETMHDLPVTIRLLDPPLHEFIPQDEQGQKEVAEAIGISMDAIQDKIEELKENNPMMGHRGCRLGITYPEITEMQVRAILEAALEVKQKGIMVIPEIMVPLVSKIKEYEAQKNLIEATATAVFAEQGESVTYQIGTMIETPRAALIADYLSPNAHFFSFGTNDLTQMTFGYSRDDAGKFLPIYLKRGLLDHDPFEEIDQYGVGQLVAVAVEKGRKANPNLSLGLCGEHGGNPASVEFCHSVGLDYVSCSPYRVPIARLAAAQAQLKNE